MCKIRILPFVFGAYCVVFSGASPGLEPTLIEWHTWPAYCKARTTKAGDVANYAKHGSSGGIKPVSATAIRRWENRLGSVTFLHVHHACYGFLLRNRARMARTEQARDANLRGALSELSYAYVRIPKERSPLLPKISREIAEVKHAQGKSWEAVKYLDDAIRYQPKNVYVYREKANYLINRGEYGPAIDTLKYGIDRLGKEDKSLLTLMSSAALKANDYESAREYARRAYAAGYKGKKLKKMLEKSGHPL